MSFRRLLGQGFRRVCLCLTLALGGCGTGLSGLIGRPASTTPAPGGPTEPLTAEEVTTVVAQAAAALAGDGMVIAVVDREGRPLAVFRKNGAPVTVQALLGGRLDTVDANELALSLARTGAFFSNDQAPLSSRTVRFISREHFPPTFAADGSVTGVTNTASGALWDIERTNRGCFLTDAYIAGQEVSAAVSLDGTGPGLGIATIPGGVPLYKSGKLVGGVGVCGLAPNQAEFAAASGSAGFGPMVADPGEIFIDGVRLPFVEQARRPGGLSGDSFDTLADVGAFVAIPNVADAAADPVAGAQGGPRVQVPEGWLVGPLDSAEMSAEEVRLIIDRCVARANRTRAAIRLPLQERTKMVIAVTSLSGDVLGLFRMPDATVFSIDVAVTKGRNVVYLSGFERSLLDLPDVPLGTAITNRTLRFGSQPFYPPGIQGTQPGPFAALRERNADAPCTLARQPSNLNQSGIVFFPGSAPLYRFGTRLVGGLGVSGDGVDQDDYVTAAGLRGYEAAGRIRADRVDVRRVTLPYLKFPRAPEEGG